MKYRWVLKGFEAEVSYKQRRDRFAALVTAINLAILVC